MEPRHGFIREKIDIKILILFIIGRVNEPMTFTQLTDIMVVDGGISYFDLTDCIAELVNTNHLNFSCDKYTITEKGRTNGEITESSLPYSVRVRAENFASELRSKIKRSSMIEASHTIRRGGGYDVELSLSDGIGVIFSATMYAADENGAKSLEDGFRANAEKAYSRFLDSLLKKE